MNEILIWFGVGIGASVWSVFCIILGMSIERAMRKQYGEQ